MIRTIRRQQRDILTQGFSEQLKIHYPVSRWEPLRWLLPQQLEQPPCDPLTLNRRYRLVEFLGYVAFRTGLVVLLTIFGLDMAGLLGEWQQSQGLDYWAITLLELLSLAAILFSVFFRNSPLWLIEPPSSPYIDKLVGRNPYLQQYHNAVKQQGRSETLMELALYEQHDHQHQQEIRNSGSRLKQERQKKRLKKQLR